MKNDAFSYDRENRKKNSRECRFTQGFRAFQAGVVRPGWDVEGREHAHAVDDHCFYSFGTGVRFPGCRDWEGMQGAREAGDRIGLFLDLDQGNMIVYKNDKCLGVMATGLNGEYCWAVSLERTTSAIGYSDDTYSVRIEPATRPIAP